MVQLTLSSHPPTARNIPEGCHATFRIPNPGSTSGVNVPKISPANDKIYSLYCHGNGNGSLDRHPSNHHGLGYFGGVLTSKGPSHTARWFPVGDREREDM